MDERIERMKHVAEKGNIDGFYNLIQEDVKYLEYVDEFPFVDTPLHIAASAGNIPIVMEMMRLKPSFARKPNRYGFIPIDLALRNGHSEMVHQLLHVDQDLVRVRGRGNMTPLHHAAKYDQLDLLNEFLSICPDSITDLTSQNETALHVALKNDKIRSFEALVGWLASSWSQNALDYERKILNWKDEEGNTVLHIAVSKKQTEAVRHLFAWSGEVDVKIENKEGKTAWGILETQTQVGNSEREMRKMLIRVGASKGSSITTDGSYAHYPRPPKCRGLEKIRTKYARQMATISDDKRNALLVVATLLLSVTYQAALNPPGGLKPDKDKPSPSEAHGPSLANGSSQAYGLSQAYELSQAYGPSPANGPSQAYGPSQDDGAYGPSQANGPSQAYGPSQDGGAYGPSQDAGAYRPSQAYGPSPDGGAYGPSQANGSSQDDGAYRASQAYGPSPDDGAYEPSPAYGPSKANGTSQANESSQNDGVSSPAYGHSQANGTSQNHVFRTVLIIRTANLVNTMPFSMFLFANSVTFLISNSVTILLIPDGYIGWMLSGTQAFLWACYIVSFAAITGYKWYWITPIYIGTALYLILLQAFSVWTNKRRRRHGLGLCGLPIRLQGKIILMKKKKPSLDAGAV